MWRYYDSSVGRYLRVDPERIDGGVNYFIYSKNNPTKFLDSTGQYANTCTFGEIRSWIGRSEPAGLSDAKASLAACCSRKPCTGIDGSNSTGLDLIVWNIIVATAIGTDRSDGGKEVCVGHPTRGCPQVENCLRCCNGRVQWVPRDTPLQTTGTVVVAGGGTVYFYYDPDDWWCSRADYNIGHNCPRPQE